MPRQAELSVLSQTFMSEKINMVTANMPQLHQGWLTSYLRGEQPLWKAFWLLMVIGTVTISAINFLIGACVVLLNTGGACPFKIGSAHFILIVTLIGLPFIWMSSFMVWKCAFNTDYVVLGYVARAFAFVNVAWSTLKEDTKFVVAGASVGLF